MDREGERETDREEVKGERKEAAGEEGKERRRE